MISSVLVLISCLYMGGLEAQESRQGSFIVTKPLLMDSLLAYDSAYRSSQKMEGFRIQIFMESGNEAVSRANQLIEEFKENFPKTPTYISF